MACLTESALRRFQRNSRRMDEFDGGRPVATRAGTHLPVARHWGLRPEEQGATHRRPIVRANGHHERKRREDSHWHQHG